MKSTLRYFLILLFLGKSFLLHGTPCSELMLVQIFGKPVSANPTTMEIKPWEAMFIPGEQPRLVKNRTAQELSLANIPFLLPGKAYIWVVVERAGGGHAIILGEELVVGREPNGEARTLGHPNLAPGEKILYGGQLTIGRAPISDALTARIDNKSGRVSRYKTVPAQPALDFVAKEMSALLSMKVTTEVWTPKPRP